LVVRDKRNLPGHLGWKNQDINLGEWLGGGGGNGRKKRKPQAGSVVKRELKGSGQEGACPDRRPVQSIQNSCDYCDKSI